MKALDWIKENRIRIAKWGGLGVACLAVGVGGFVGARYFASGATYDGELLDIAPADVSVVAIIDDVPARRIELDRFLDSLAGQPGLSRLERSAVWDDLVGKPLEEARADTLNAGVKRAERGADDAGVSLFEDVLSGELVVCTDPARSDAEGTDFLVLTRVSRNVRFKWQFMDIAQMFLPAEPDSPRFDYDNNVLQITPRPTPDNPEPRSIRVAILDDVLVASNSGRLFNASVGNHAGGTSSVSASQRFSDTRQLVDAERRESHAMGLWLNLDRMRERLPATTEDGQTTSPVDRFNGLPGGVVSVYPDVFEPLDRILRMNLDTRPFGAAWYGIDLSEPGELRFDQYLLVNHDKASREQFAHLRKTWNIPGVEQSQLAFLPEDTMLEVSYLQPVDVLYDEVLSQRERDSLIGDFIEAVQRPNVQARMEGPPGGLMFATFPREFAPGASIPLSGTDLPLPGFAIGFRTEGADPDSAQALLQEYLYTQRGVEPGDEPREGPVKVVRKEVAGQAVFGFHDPRKRADGEESFIYELNRSIRAALVGDWLLLTNSEMLLDRAFDAVGGGTALVSAGSSPWRRLTGRGNATIYVDFDRIADFASSPELFQVLRDSKYNPALIEGRDPGELRREIARNLGYDPTVTENLLESDVRNEYNRRKAAWEQTCETEGKRYQVELQRNVDGLRFFRDLAVLTRFGRDHLHAQGTLRVGD